MRSIEHMRLQMLKETNKIVDSIIAREKPTENDLWVLLKIALSILVRLRRFILEFKSRREMESFIRNEVKALKALKTDLRNKVIRTIVDVLIIH